MDSVSSRALVAAMKETITILLGWLAHRLEIGDTDRIASPLTRVLVPGGLLGAEDSGFQT